jgi:hypothetical protein
MYIADNEHSIVMETEVHRSKRTPSARASTSTLRVVVEYEVGLSHTQVIHEMPTLRHALVGLELVAELT